MKMIKVVGVSLIIAGVLVMAPPLIYRVMRLCPARPSSIHEAQAVAQFTRKYNMSCTACHTAFPRLTPVGERFKANGFQMMGTEDGDEVGKSKITDRLNISELGNLLGMRVAFNVASIKTKSLDRDANGTKESTLLNFGNPDCLQFFTA